MICMYMYMYIHTLLCIVCTVHVHCSCTYEIVQLYMYRYELTCRTVYSYMRVPIHVCVSNQDRGCLSYLQKFLCPHVSPGVCGWGQYECTGGVVQAGGLRGRCVPSQPPQDLLYPTRWRGTWDGTHWSVSQVLLFFCCCLFCLLNVV